MKYILSYGGGINSSALLFYILDNKLPLDLVIFADTGEELKETYECVERMKTICLNNNLEFVTVKSSKGNLYDYYYSKKAVMSMMRRDCTGKFKISPIRAYIRERFGNQETFTMYIGITYDEFHRCKNSNVKYIIHSYPFVKDKIDRIGNLKILKQHNFTAFKSGCKGCMYNKKANWIKMLRDNPEEFERHLKLEENGSAFPRVLLNGSYSLRSLKEKYNNQSSLESFEDVETTCNNINGGCFL